MGMMTENNKYGKRRMNKLNRVLSAKYAGRVRVREEADRIVVSGSLESWKDIVDACAMCVGRSRDTGMLCGKHVVNDIVLEGHMRPAMRVPALVDDALEGSRPDVLIIGGGISGTSIARELSRWKLDILLVDKEADLAMHASGRNDGEVHPGVDLKKGSLKQHYVLRGNRMFDRICAELDVKFTRCGQYVCFDHLPAYPLALMYVWNRKAVCGVRDTRLIGRRELLAKEKHVHASVRFAMYNPSAGCVCPYGLTIAYGENAVQNGVRISLNTAVLGMEVQDGRINSVQTNRGTVYPGLVINAAGVFAEDVAEMAGDRFYSIHPRRGTNSILDKKAASQVKSIVSVRKNKKTQKNSKGGAILHTVDGNLLVGPDAVETYEKENFATGQASIDTVLGKQQAVTGRNMKPDIITYFTGVRAPTFEEDFIVEKGRRTANLIHCAGIQSPGLTTAPAVAEDVAQMTVTELTRIRGGDRNSIPEKNPAFNPVRKAPPRLKELPDEERDRLIRENPDYGVIICRCEEISRGEILDALRSPLPVYTVDGVKKRVRPGMGRCQGSFCMPHVAEIIAEYTKVPISEVRKAGGESIISYGRTKG